MLRKLLYAKGHATPTDLTDEEFIKSGL